MKGEVLEYVPLCLKAHLDQLGSTTQLKRDFEIRQT